MSVNSFGELSDWVAQYRTLSFKFEIWRGLQQGTGSGMTTFLPRSEHITNNHSIIRIHNGYCLEPYCS
jgi:hypothetical protein